MAENQLMHGLKRQYAKTLGFIEAGEDRGDDLAALARVIRMFKPDADLSAIKPIRPYVAGRSKYLADALAVLRQANAPMTPRAIARRVLAARGVPLVRRNLLNVECSLHAVLERMEGDGVERVGDEPKRWRVDTN